MSRQRLTDFHDNSAHSGGREWRRLQERLNPAGKLLLGFLASKRSGSHDYMQPDLGFLGQAQDSLRLLFEQAAGAFVTGELKMHRR